MALEAVGEIEMHRDLVEQGAGSARRGVMSTASMLARTSVICKVPPYVPETKESVDGGIYGYCLSASHHFPPGVHCPGPQLSCVAELPTA